MSFDGNESTLLLRGARVLIGEALADDGQTHDLLIRGDRIVAIEPAGTIAGMAGSSRWRLEKLEGMRGVITFRSDGEVRVVCDIPLEDGSVTSAQLSRMLTLVAWTVDQFDPVIRLAGTEGKVDFVALDARILQKSPEPRRRKSRSKRERRERADLIKAAGGVEGLRKLLEGHGL